MHDQSIISAKDAAFLAPATSLQSSLLEPWLAIGDLLSCPVSTAGVEPRHVMTRTPGSSPAPPAKLPTIWMKYALLCSFAHVLHDTNVKAEWRNYGPSRIDHGQGRRLSSFRCL